MRINQYVARATSLSRRKADQAISEGRVRINDIAAELGSQVKPDDTVSLDGALISLQESVSIIVHKPINVISGREGHGHKTIYDILPKEYQQLNIAGRLDKDSEGLLLMTNDGDFLHSLTHPSQDKTKTYTVELDTPLNSTDKNAIESGVDIKDEKPSSFPVQTNPNGTYTVTLQEGRNRQIRRTFGARGYTVTRLVRTDIGPYSLGNLAPGEYKLIK